MEECRRYWGKAS